MFEETLGMNRDKATTEDGSFCDEKEWSDNGNMEERSAGERSKRSDLLDDIRQNVRLTVEWSKVDAMGEVESKNGEASKWSKEDSPRWSEGEAQKWRKTEASKRRKIGKFGGFWVFVAFVLFAGKSAEYSALGLGKEREKGAVSIETFVKSLSDSAFNVIYMIRYTGL